MKRVLFATLGTVAGLVALLDFKSHGHPLAAVGALPSASASTPSSSAASSPSASSSSSPRPASSGSSSRSTAGTASKQYTGAAVETRYGVVQVAVTVTGTHIDSVDFVRLDAFDGHSQQINSQAGPILLQETLSAQSANIDAVSGATYTSDGYVQSLQSALDAAGIK
ncbi:MAG: FMN-binding protein [Actinobacteria bacterium]|nr:FMN-binding protein [Actinomycetota bacterium]